MKFGPCILSQHIGSQQNYILRNSFFSIVGLILCLASVASAQSGLDSLPEILPPPPVLPQFWCDDSFSNTGDSCTTVYGPIVSIIELPDYPNCPLSAAYYLRRCCNPPGTYNNCNWQVQLIGLMIDRHLPGNEGCDALLNEINNLPPLTQSNARPNFMLSLYDKVFVAIARLDVEKAVLESQQSGNPLPPKYICPQQDIKYRKIQGSCMSMSSYPLTAENNPFKNYNAVDIHNPGGLLPNGGVSISPEGLVIEYYICGTACCNQTISVCYNATTGEPQIEVHVVETPTPMPWADCGAMVSTNRVRNFFWVGETIYPCTDACKEFRLPPPKNVQSPQISRKQK